MCRSYCSILLINCDLKILTSILAQRINRIITEIIHPDQASRTGHYSGDNLHRLLNIMTHAQGSGVEAMVLSFDAEKAFDQVSWVYLFQTSDGLGFGPNFVRWVQILYSNPQASVTANF